MSHWAAVGGKWAELPNLTASTGKGVFRRCVIITSLIFFFFFQVSHVITSLSKLSASNHSIPSQTSWPLPFFPCFFLMCAVSTLLNFASLCLSVSSAVIAPKSLHFPPESIPLVLYFLPPPAAPCITPSLSADGGGGSQRDATSPLVKLGGAINSPEVWLAARWLQPSFHPLIGRGAERRELMKIKLSKWNDQCSEVMRHTSATGLFTSIKVMSHGRVVRQLYFDECTVQR